MPNRRDTPVAQPVQLYDCPSEIVATRHQMIDRMTSHSTVDKVREYWRDHPEDEEPQYVFSKSTVPWTNDGQYDIGNCGEVWRVTRKYKQNLAHYINPLNHYKYTPRRIGLSGIVHIRGDHFEPLKLYCLLHKCGYVNWDLKHV